MAKSYNYSIAEDYKQKIVIPYIWLELDGWLTFISAMVGGITVALVLGVVLSTVMGTTGFYISSTIAFCGIFVLASFINEINNDTGRNKLQEFYYLSIKKYKYIYDSEGNVQFLKSKKKGEIFSACK